MMHWNNILKHLTLPNAIIFAALFVSAPRLAAAFSLVEPPLAGFPIERITGPAFGFCVIGCAVYTWNVWETKIKRLKNEKSIRRVNLLLVGWAGLLVLIAVALVPPMLLELRTSKLAALISWPWDLVYCIVIALATEGVIALVAFAKSIAEPANPKRATANATGRKSEKPAKTYIAQCEVCDWMKEGCISQRAATNARSAHMRKHKDKSGV